MFVAVSSFLREGRCDVERGRGKRGYPHYAKAEYEEKRKEKAAASE